MCSAVFILMNSARKFLDELFFESGKNTPEEGEDTRSLEKKQTKSDDVDHGGSASETLKNKQDKLVKILSELGIEDPKSRLEIKNGSFRLTSTCLEQHQADRDILTDLTKITPLIDADFVAVDVEKSNDDKYFSYIIIASDLLPDVELDPDIEDVEKTTEKDPKGDKFLKNPDPKGTKGSKAWQNSDTHESASKLIVKILGENEVTDKPEETRTLEQNVYLALDNALENEYSEVLTDAPEDIAVDMCSYSSLFSSVEDCSELIPFVRKWQEEKRATRH